MLRCATEVYQEYQRVLWDDAVDHPTRINVSADKSKRRQVPAGAASVKVYARSSAGPGEDSMEEWHYHRYGAIGIFLLDTKGNHLRSDGRIPSTMGNMDGLRPLISKRQRMALQEVLQDQSLRVLVLVSDTPFVQVEDHDEHMEIPALLDPTGVKQNHTEDAFFAGAPSAFVPLESMGDEPMQKAGAMGTSLQWSGRPRELVKLLTDIFDWKSQSYPYREALLLSGGTGVGFTSDIRDHRLGLSIAAVVAGPMVGEVEPFEPRLQSGKISERFSYTHRPIEGQWSFCVVDVDLSSWNQKPSVDLQLVGQPVPEAGTTTLGALKLPSWEVARMRDQRKKQAEGRQPSPKAA